MRKTIVINLLLAGLALAGCQKGVNYGGRPVSFSASSADPYTRTAYSNVVTNGFERIDWSPNDRILVWSDFAEQANNANAHSAEYIIDVITPDGRNSKATLKNATANGLVYVSGKDSYKFWATYPVASGNPTAGSVSYTIPATQQLAAGATATTADHVTTFPADMSNAWLLAAAEGAEADKPVDMYFYPGFTAFELTFAVDKEYEGNITVSKVELISESGLAGSVTATLAPGTRVNNVTNGEETKAHTIGASTYACTSAGNVAYELPANTVVSATESVSFTVFALPQNIAGLKLKFHVTADGEETTFTGALKKNGNPINFGMCEKHRIKGVALPGNVWKIYYKPGIVTADEWIEAGEAQTTNLIVE